MRSKLRWLILARVVTAVSLLWAGARLTHGDLRGHGPWRSPGTILLVIGGLTIIYAVAQRLSRAVVLQARVQFTIDILLVTWLIGITNDIHSPYTALYIVIISLASVFLGPRDAIITSVACAVAFTGSALVVMVGISPRATQGVEASLSETIQSVGLFDVALFVVGLLSARLAERQSRSDVQLIAATQSLASLRALHERIVESIRSGVVTTDLEGKIYTFNAAAEEITGYDAEDVRGQEASILFGDISNDIKQSLHAAEAGEASPRFEASCLTAEGLRLRLGFGISPLFSESGETTGIVITFQDLTQIRALEEASRRQDRLAAVGRMAASIAHEIRNPLAAMRGSIQMLRSEMGTADPAQAQLMEIILRESDRLNRIIADFLNYARPRSIVRSQTDVGELLRETFTLMRHSPEMTDHQKLEERLPDKPILADVDAEQLRQVFWNLARNALQAMPDAGTLRAEVGRIHNGRLRITFADNGCGMSPEQVEHLFEPFSSTTGGSGLGLSIVYQIIRDHGGTINARSREGQGTTIMIELPGENGVE